MFTHVAVVVCVCSFSAKCPLNRFIALVKYHGQRIVPEQQYIVFPIDLNNRRIWKPNLNNYLNRYVIMLECTSGYRFFNWVLSVIWSLAIGWTSCSKPRPSSSAVTVSMRQLVEFNRSRSSPQPFMLTVPSAKDQVNIDFVETKEMGRLRASLRICMFIYHHHLHGMMLLKEIYMLLVVKTISQLIVQSNNCNRSQCNIYK